MAAAKILAAADTIKQGIRAIPGLKLLGDPLCVLAFASDELDIYRVIEAMIARGWNLNGLHRPAERFAWRKIADFFSNFAINWHWPPPDRH